MSVTKPGSDDHNCGFTNNDPLHQAICRVVAGGITVVAAAANDHHNAAKNIPASYDEVITVSALADTDGKAGGVGGNRCYSWGTYDKDDTFANFSNYGGDVDIIAPGKCIMSTIPGARYAYMSGTSMAAPTVAGAVALYKESRPNATPAEVREALRYLGNLHWATSTDPDPSHEPLLDVSRIHDPRDLRLRRLPRRSHGPSKPARRHRSRSRSTRSGDVLRAGPAVDHVAARRLDRRSVAVQPDGLEREHGTPARGGPGRHAARSLRDRRPGHQPGPHRDEDDRRRGRRGRPDRRAAESPRLAARRRGWARRGLRRDVAWPAATDPSSGIAGYELQSSRNGGAWSAVDRAAAPTQRTRSCWSGSTRATGSGSGPSTRPGTGARGSRRRRDQHPRRRRPQLVDRPVRGAGRRRRRSRAYRTTDDRLVPAPERSLTMTFTGHGIAVVAPRSAHRGSATGLHRRRRTSGRSSCGPGRRPVARSSSPADFAGGGTHTITRPRRRGRPRPAVPARRVRRLEVVACNGPPLARVRYRDRPDVPGPGIPGTTG